MACKGGRFSKTSTPKGIFIVPPSPKGWTTKAKASSSPHEVRLALLDKTQYFNVLGIMCQVFPFRNEYKIRSFMALEITLRKSDLGQNSISFLGHLIGIN